MANLVLYLLLLLLHLRSTAATPPGSAAANFIKSSCRATHYPSLCIHSLSVYASQIQQSDQQLAQAALSVSLSSAQSTTVFVSRQLKAAGIKPREYQAIRDCTRNMADAVVQLNRSIGELGQIGRPSAQDFDWHMSNVQTWVSAAITAANTCIDGFSDPAMIGALKSGITAMVTTCSQVTSNALALVARFGEKMAKGRNG